MKVIIFDSGTLISFTMAGLVDEFVALRKSFDGKFIIPWLVKQELIDKPIHTKRFVLEAMKIQKMLDDGILELPDSVGVSKMEIDGERKNFEDLANNIFTTKRGPVRIIHDGEASCLGLSKILTKKGIDNIIAIDERTTRVLSEKPENLRRIMENKLHSKIDEKRGNYKYFKDFRFIRSPELVYVAYKKGLVPYKKGDVLDALLYAVKFKGAAISGEEIREIERLG